MTRLILKQIAENLQSDFYFPDISKFSKNKTLYSFQVNALKNALKVLWKYYQNEIRYFPGEDLSRNEERKQMLFKLYDLEKDPTYDLSKKEGKKIAKLLEEYYSVEDGKVSFIHFINRMGFWMATGSGKTLVIIKLMEILHHLIKDKKIPNHNILFLTHRDDLLEQFKELVKEFNEGDNSVKINLKSLKEYEDWKRNPTLFSEEELTVFYYRSDLISDESKEKLVDFRTYENQGRWYIFLDEAHKGDKEESKRQILYSIMTRNGFLFNFSATFTDPRDFITTVFSFNLADFIEEGYGKHIYISEEEIRAFKEKISDFSPEEKQKIILRSLILLSYIKKYLQKVRRIKKDIYHNPLLLTLVNSVNTEDADLKIFFDELEKIAEGRISYELFEEAKQNLINLFIQDKNLEFEKREISFDKEVLERITFKDILVDIFNSQSPGKIEVLTIPKNRKELVFKLKTSDKPFALIKIGDITNWLKDKLSGYEVIESFDNESVFKKLNKDDSSINILMGSRTFYEGWDSNRPNIILFINIGVGKQAKKFVQQSIGRGVRIEPLKDKRKRTKALFREGKMSGVLYTQIKEFIFPLETLFIFGTKATVLKDIINTFREYKSQEYSLEGIIIKSKEAEKLPLYVPIYKPFSYSFVDTQNFQKFPIHKDDFKLMEDYVSYLGDDRVMLMYHNLDVKILEALKKSFQKPDNYYDFSFENKFNNPFILIGRFIKHFSIIPEKLEGFDKVKEKIVHFKKIRFSLTEKLHEFLKKIDLVKKSVKEYQDLQMKMFQDAQDINFIKKAARKLSYVYKNMNQSFDGINIKYIQNHYYFPILLSTTGQKIHYLNHIITNKSEVDFINQLEEYLETEDNAFSKLEWWMFSKLDETVDEVYIPWYNTLTNSIEKFKPDFIFWLKPKNTKKYLIIFVDPKSTEYVEAYRKINGFKKVFGGNRNSKIFTHENFEIEVKLFLKPAKGDTSKAIKDKAFWIDEIKKIFQINL